jgi:uncharacterized membrane protein YbhN (UPF0104 family)
LIAGTRPHAELITLAVVGGVVVLLLVTLLASDTAARYLGRAAEGTLTLIHRVTRRRYWPEAATMITKFHEQVATQLAGHWARFGLGAASYALSQVLLLAACLSAVGAKVPLTVVLIAYATERALTAIPITPGGSGVADTAAVATLVAYHGPAAACAAGLLAYRLFVTGLEIPLGALWALAWFVRRRRLGSTRAATSPAGGEGQGS